MELVEVDPEKSSRRMWSKQPPDPELPKVPLPQQHPDGHLLPRTGKALDRGEQAHGSGGDAGSGGDVGPEDFLDDGPADGVLDVYGNVVPFWGDESEDVPALHAMRAGQKKCFSTTSSTGLGFNNQVSRATMPKIGRAHV